jgi:hypothetical protein
MEFHQSLSLQNRIHLLERAAALKAIDLQSLVFEFLNDSHSDLRASVYRLLARDAVPSVENGMLIQFLSEHVESNPAIEEEATLAISTLEKKCADTPLPDAPQQLESIMNRTEQLFSQLQESGRKIFSDTHELGWLIVRSKEYLEYYGDERLRDAVVQHLRNKGSQSKVELLQRLKDSAVRIEARHLEGYNALVDIIKNPERSGGTLIARELILAKIGKGEIMYRLMRNLRLSRIFHPGDHADLIHEIFEWARKAKLYRLAESALYVLSKIESSSISELCAQFLTPPTESRTLAVASIQLLKELDWELLEPVVISLISQTSDQFLLVKLIDALSSSNIPASVELIIVMMGRLVFESDQELLFKLSGILSSRADYDIVDGLMNMYDYAEKSKKPVILHLIGGLSIKRATSGEGGLKDFLKRILEKDSMSNKVLAATLLYRMAEIDATYLFSKIISRAKIEDKTEIIRGLSGSIHSDIVPYLIGFLYESNGLLHEALRDALLSVDDEHTLTHLFNQIESIGGKDAAAGTNAEIDAPVSESDREHTSEGEKRTQGVTVVFAGFYDHEKPVMDFSSPDMKRMFTRYKSVLYSIFSKQGGRMIKKSAGKHIFHFRSPLLAVLASLQVQEEIEKIGENQLYIRIGIHCSPVREKNENEGASSEIIPTLLSNSARNGSLLISDTVQRRVDKSIGSRSVGTMRLKNVSTPIHVYEPSNIKGDYAADVRQSDSSKTPFIEPGSTAESVFTAREKRLLQLISQTFATLNTLSRAVEEGRDTPVSMREELAKSWNNIRKIVGVPPLTDA